MHKVWYDTETTGLNPLVHNILTAYFHITDENLNTIDSLYLQLKPSDLSKLNITTEAMEVNKIDLDTHLKDPNTLTYEDGKEVLKSFLKKYKIKGTRKTYTQCGHNLQFDKDMIHNQLIPKEEFENECLVHYRTLDTSTVCNFLKDVGYFPSDLGTLSSLAHYFNIPNTNAHNAKEDVLMNIEVYKNIVNLMKSKKSNSLSTTNSSLLEIIEL